ncbi:MAG: RNA polymerase factor sigma-54 [Parachlamydiaceae bacterium]|nr:RNA polymerase factor sigma-54 [Parachlamydiaceae bacterium]
MTQPSSLELRLKQGQNLRQMQRLIMSPQMQQAISLLQMPLIELADRIDEELVQNPILESSEEDSRSDDVEEVDAAAEGTESIAEIELTFDADNFDILKRLDEDLREHFDQSSGYSSTISSEDEKLRTFIENSISSRESLFEHLMHQARETFETSQHQAMAEALIGNFDSSGFLNTPLSEIASLSGFELSELLDTLYKIQHFEPIGVGARSLQESLLIQLRCLGKKESLAYKLVESNFEDLLNNHIPQIQKAQNCSSGDIACAIRDVISKLDLHPGASFSNTAIQPIFPDVTIIQEDEKLIVKINDESMPSLRLNRRYMRYLDDPAMSSETKEFVKQKIVSAKWFLRNIHQRNETLEKIASSLTKCQYEFFTDPDGKLQPLTMQRLADELHLHESTIARAVSNKFVDCPRGILPLRFFFTNAYVTEDGDDISSKTVKEVLLEIVNGENKQKPLSDDAISAQLKERGIPCARRTVAKYRCLLNLGNAHQRKKFI